MYVKTRLIHQLLRMAGAKREQKEACLEPFKYHARGGGQKRAKLCPHSILISEPRMLFQRRIGTRNT